MNHNSDQPTGRFGLLASGTSGRWTIDLDESTDGLEWSLQLDGPQVYVHFPIRDPSIVRDALDYLRAGRSTSELRLGQLDSSSVSLFWDHEEDQRCFLIVTPKPQWTMRVTLSIQDTVMLADALEQILEDLPQAAPS